MMLDVFIGGEFENELLSYIKVFHKEKINIKNKSKIVCLPLPIDVCILPSDLT